MIKKFLVSLEDPERPLLGPNYWLSKKIGIILPENKLAKAAYIIVHFIGAMFLVTQLIELYVIRSDLNLVLTNLKISMLSTTCVVKAFTCVFWQSDWRKVFDYITEADKYERDTRDTVKGKILDTYTKYCRNVTYLYWALVLTTCVTVSQTPLIIFLSSSTFREGFRNGTESFPHIYSSWMPVDKNHFPGSCITIALHCCTTSYGGLMVAAYDTNIIVMLVFFGGKLDLLRERSKQMLGSSGTGISDEKASKIIRELHVIHVLLIRYSRLFNSLLSPVMFVYVVICALMICASAFQLRLAQDMTQKILMAEYLIFSIAQLFNFCWHSNVVIVKSEDLVYGPYESEWWSASLYQRKAIHILAGQFRNKYVFTAGPFTPLTLATFIAILKGAYSYYTLLSQAN